jgi:hypothetical protein
MSILMSCRSYASTEASGVQLTSFLNDQHKPILAERFKTKMCQNYEREGFCPYEARCMFAHGEEDLRTSDMNMADNLVTEEAIKAWQRSKTVAVRLAARKRAKKAAKRETERNAKAAAASVSSCTTDLPRPATPPSAAHIVVPDSDGSATGTPTKMTPATVASVKTPASATVPMSAKNAVVVSPATAPASTKPSIRYRHNPYAAIPLTSAASATSAPSAAVPSENSDAAAAMVCLPPSRADPRATFARSFTSYTAPLLVPQKADVNGPCYCAHCRTAMAHGTALNIVLLA